jgi:zinc finger protein
MTKDNQAKDVKSKEEGQPDIVEGQQCPVCGKNTLTLTDTERDVPYFGKIFLFSMDCSNCGFFKADVETDNTGKPIKITYNITKEDDLKVRIIKSSTATVKIPRITTIEPGATSNGYVTNIEGIFNRVKTQIEKVRDEAEDKADRTKAKNLLKKIRKIMWGEESITITIEDPNGNSAIIAEGAVITKGK